VDVGQGGAQRADSTLRPAQAHRYHSYSIPTPPTVLFHPGWSNGTAAVRGTAPLNGRRAYWEIEVSHRLFGTSLMFGVGTARARTHESYFTNLLGVDEHSWGACLLLECH